MSESWVDVDACTLPTAEQPLRVAEFDALYATNLVRVELLNPTRARLILAGGRDLVSRVRDLADREADCCSFFTFAVNHRERADGNTEVELMVEVPREYSHVLDALVRQAAAQIPTSS